MSNEGLPILVTQVCNNWRKLQKKAFASQSKNGDEKEKEKKKKLEWQFESYLRYKQTQKC